MRYYLARWELDTDVAGDFWRAPASGVVGLVDLRPLAAQGTLLSVDGYGFFAYPGTVDPTLMTDQIDLGGDLDGAILNKKEVETAFGVVFSSTTIKDVLWELLTTKSDPKGLTGPKPLIPGTDLTLKLLLGGHSVIRSEPFDIDTAPHRLQLIETQQDGYRELRTEALKHSEGDSRKETHLRWLSVQEQKYKTDYRTFLGDLPDEGTKPPGTSFGDSFNRADNTDLNASNSGKTKDGVAGTWPWNEVAGTGEIISNQFRRLSSIVYCRCDDDMSSGDHFCEFDISTVTASGSEKQTGPCARFSSSENTSYMLQRRFSTPLSSAILRLRKTITSSRTNLGPSDITQTAAAGEKITCKIDGSTLSGEHDDVEKDSITDTAIGDTNLRGGIYMTGTQAEVLVNDWFCEDIAAAAAYLPLDLAHQPQHQMLIAS